MVAYYADDGLLKPPLHVIRYDRKTGGIPDLINAELARSMEQLNEQAGENRKRKIAGGTGWLTSPED
jgi:hypothetical protein